MKTEKEVVQAVEKKSATPKASAKKTGVPRQTRSKRNSAVSGHATSPDSRLEMISVAAYYKAEQRGFSEGFELDDWLAAEREVDEMLEHRSTTH